MGESDILHLSISTDPKDKGLSKVAPWKEGLCTKLCSHKSCPSHPICSHVIIYLRRQILMLTHLVDGAIGITINRCRCPEKNPAVEISLYTEI